MKVMVGGAESASVTRTSGVCPGSLSRALKVHLSSPSFWQCFLISRAWRTLQASWPRLIVRVTALGRAVAVR